MTDLEALECIVVDLTPKAKEHNKEEIEQVRKSLEVLELIKNNKIIFLRAIFNERNSYCGQSNVEVERAKEFQEELNKIKEWLENDK